MADKGLILLQSRVLFLQALHLRQLRPAHAAEALPPVVVGCITDPDAPTSRCHVIARCQLKLDLTQQLQDVFVRMSRPRHANAPFGAHCNGPILRGEGRGPLAVFLYDPTDGQEFTPHSWKSSMVLYSVLRKHEKRCVAADSLKNAESDFPDK